MTSAPAIRAQNVWKLFGQDPGRYFASLPADKSFEQMRADGYIAGVRDVSVDVHSSEILVIMGLSG